MTCIDALFFLSLLLLLLLVYFWHTWGEGGGGVSRQVLDLMLSVFCVWKVEDVFVCLFFVRDKRGSCFFISCTGQKLSNGTM